MQYQLAITEKTIKAGDGILVTGRVTPDAKRFAINLGRDRHNLLLHFNPRFETSDIVCNSKACGVWGQELRDSLFPFQRGEEAKISVSFDARVATVMMPGNKVIKFPNRLGMDSVQYFSVAGDFKIKSVKFLNFYVPFAALN